MSLQGVYSLVSPVLHDMVRNCPICEKEGMTQVLFDDLSKFDIQCGLFLQVNLTPHLPFSELEIDKMRIAVSDISSVKIHRYVL